MRVCFVCHEYPPGLHGGIGTLTQMLARTLVNRGHEARVIGVYAPSDPAPDAADDGGVMVRRLRAAHYPGSWVAARYRLFQRVRDWVRRGEVDVVEVPDYEGWAAGWPRLPVPVVARLSGSGTYFAVETGRPPRPLTRWLERATLRRADYWIAESRHVLTGTMAAFGLEPPAHRVLYNPVDVPAAVPFAARTPHRVVFAGTLTEKKGILSLLAAWPQVLRACPDAELHIYGKDGMYQGHSMREQIPAADSVRVFGHVTLEQLQCAFQEARVVVLPSYAEGFALTPLHAMATGCPTVYTKRGSGPEVIEDERDGLLVDPDRPDEIAGALIRVLRDDELAARLGAAGRARVQTQFSPATVGAENERFYRECLTDFRRAPRVRGVPTEAARAVTREVAP